jgi:hypothetical protein
MRIRRQFARRGLENFRTEVQPVNPGWRKNDLLNQQREWQPVMGQLKFRWEISTSITDIKPGNSG